MGSFNLSCLISKVTITSGDIVYFVPLTDSIYTIKNPKKRLSNGMLYSPLDIYTPAYLPFKVIYNDCGNFKCIDNNAVGVKLIEADTNLTISEFIDTFDQESKKYDNLKLNYCLIHENVFNKCIENYNLNDKEEIENFYDSENFSKFINFIPPSKATDGLKRHYDTFELFNTFTINKKNIIVYSKYTLKNNNESKKNNPQLYNQFFFDYLWSMPFKLAGILNYNEIPGSVHRLLWQSLPKWATPTDTKELYHQCVEVHKLICFMYKTSIIFSTWTAGPQCGEVEMTEFLGRLIAETSISKKKR